MSKSQLFVGVMLVVLVFSISTVAQTPANSARTVLFKEPASARSFTSGPLSVSRLKEVFAPQKGITVFLQFDKLPDASQRRQMARAGIQLHEYIPRQVYLASVERSFTETELKKWGITGIQFPDHSIKKSPELKAAHPALQTGLKKYHIWLAPGVDKNEAGRNLESAIGAEKGGISEIRPLYDRMLEISLDAANLDKLLNLDFVLYAQEVPELSALNQVETESHLASRVHVGDATTPGLTGKDVTIGVGDAGRVYHIDLVNYQPEPVYIPSAHATHVVGTLAGKGLVNPLMKGFAYDANLEIDYFNTIIYRTPELYQQKRMVITNNSYGGGSVCLPYSGQYSGYCGQVDQQLLDMPHLVHVFAAGNTSNLKCGDFPTSYRTIDNAFQAAKNVITVGGTNELGTQSIYAKGPTVDGRIKPEITAISWAVVSTGTNNNYGRLEGTSMASPQVSGTLALLYERYRQLFGGADPEGDLMKALICNTATDMGTPYVDFAYGFGWLNAHKAIETLNRKSWFSSAVEHQEETSFEIELTKEVKNFKIMLYWHDRPASYYSAKALVNDLDITVQLPDGSVYDPYILDTSVNGVLKQAVRGKDHVNNIEQVVIDHAMPGRYLIKVKGYEVPFGPQAFKVVYNWDDVELKLIQPAGGELYKPSQSRLIQWSHPGHESDAYEFSYSNNNGTTWTVIPEATITNNRRNWNTPGFASTNVIFRIKHQASGQERISQPFTVLPEVNFTATSSCETAIDLSWRRHTGVDSMAVLFFNGTEMETIKITSDTNYRISNLKGGQRYWVTVRPIRGTKMGERAVAKSVVTASNVFCDSPGTVGDFSIRAEDSLLVNRIPSLRNAQLNFRIDLRNESQADFSDTIFLRVLKNGSDYALDTLVKTWTGGERYRWNSSIKAAGTPGESAQFKLVVSNKQDSNPLNDTAVVHWRYLATEPLVLPLVEDMSSLPDTTYSAGRNPGLAGWLNWDLNLSSSAISASSRTGQGIFLTSRLESQMAELIGYYNFSNYSVNDDIRMMLDIPDFNQLGVDCHIRGNDTSRWISLALVDPFTMMPALSQINIVRALEQAGQDFSSSFQIRFRFYHNSYVPTLHALKKLQFFIVPQDLTLFSSSASRQFLTDGESVTIRLRAKNNSKKPVESVLFGITLPDGSTRTSSYGQMGAGDTANVNISVDVQNWPPGAIDLKTWIAAEHDPNPKDDTLAVSLSYTPKVTEFPYLESFENGKAGWTGTYVYEHSSNLSESIAPYKAANGTGFWGTRWIAITQGIGYVVPSGYLYSPLFDLQGLNKPHFAASVNKQLCDNRDSVYVEYSIDTGRTWRRLVADDDITNWYKTADGYSWVGCKDPEQDRWRVISAPLPDAARTIQLRFTTLPKDDFAYTMPRTPGGFLVDDIHIYSLDYPLFNGSTGTARLSNLNSGQMMPALSGGEVFAALTPLGTRMSQVELSARAHNGPASFSGNPVLPYQWTVHNPTADREIRGKIRLYISDEKVQSWLNANPCDTCKQKLSAYDLSVFRYAGPGNTINQVLNDNKAGYETVWDPEGFDLVPYDKGYYAEVETPLYGEFYLGRNINLVDLEFDAARLASQNGVELSWKIQDWQGVQRFELEKSTNADGGFEVISSVNIASNTALQGTYQDLNLAVPGTYYYRVRLQYANGQIRYSSQRIVRFRDVMEATVFPNPASGSSIRLRLDGVQPGQLSLELVDRLGRRVAAAQVPVTVGEQLINLSGLTSGKPGGVYWLRIQTGGQKKTIPLVISGN